MGIGVFLVRDGVKKNLFLSYIFFSFSMSFWFTCCLFSSSLMISCFISNSVTWISSAPFPKVAENNHFFFFFVFPCFSFL